MKQNTLNGEFSLQGKGLHTGKAVTATFKPGAENTGYVIVRTDVEGCPEIPALAKYVEQADRASCLVKDGVKVFTLEHAMAALYGCGVDNCRAVFDELENGQFGNVFIEMSACEGSCKKSAFLHVQLPFRALLLLLR